MPNSRYTTKRTVTKPEGTKSPFTMLQPFGGGQQVLVRGEESAERVGKTLKLDLWAEQNGIEASRGARLAVFLVEFCRDHVQRTRETEEARNTLNSALNRVHATLLALEKLANKRDLANDSLAADVRSWVSMLTTLPVPASSRDNSGIKSRLPPVSDRHELLGVFRLRKVASSPRGRPISLTKVATSILLAAWWYAFNDLPRKREGRLVIDLVSNVLMVPVENESIVYRALRKEREGFKKHSRCELFGLKGAADTSV